VRVLRRPTLEEVAIVLVAAMVFLIPRLWDQVDVPVDTTPAPVSSRAQPSDEPRAVPTAEATDLPAPRACDFRDEIERVRGAVVRISAPDGGGGVRAGSGFHLGDGLYVTAAHVVMSDGGEVLPGIEVASTVLGDTFAAEVVAVGSFSDDRLERDLATVRSVPLDDRLSSRPPSENDIDAVVRVIGYPWSQVPDDASALSAPVVIRGTLASTSTAGGIDIVQSSVRTEKGMSGGPLVDECGIALAVTSGVPVRLGNLGQLQQGFGVFISMAEIERLQ